jgi:hypothetical protein
LAFIEKPLLVQLVGYIPDLFRKSNDMFKLGRVGIRLLIIWSSTRPLVNCNSK